MKTKTIISLYYLGIAVLLTSCYIDSKKIPLNKFKAAYDELSRNNGLVKSIFTNQNRIKYVEFDLENFSSKSIKAFPDTYKLMQSKNAVRIIVYPSGCVFFILKVHKGLYDDEYECLRAYGESECVLFKDGCVKIKEQEKLQGNWTYQLIYLHICD